MQADAEHQQDNADLGQLRAKVGVGHEARRERADDNAGKQITDQGGEPQTGRNSAEYKRQTDADSDNGNERRIVWHYRLKSVLGKA